MSERARHRRMREFTGRFPDLASMSVIDLGGTAEFWNLVPVKPASVRVVNLDPATLNPPGDGITVIVADACSYKGPPADLVVSNSLIEHLGGVKPRTEFASAVRRLAPRFWIQTPYRYFPLEPHWMFPGMQFMPLPARARLARRHWTVGTVMAPDYAMKQVRWTELIGVTEMRELFPDGEIWRERIGGLTKSIVAVL